MTDTKTEAPDVGTVPAQGISMAIEVVVIPVADVDRAMRFYAGLGWRLDLDFDSGNGYGVIQFTPPGSGCSIIFGRAVSLMSPGSAKGLHLVVEDIESARADLLRRGVKVSEIFHDPSGIFHRVGPDGSVPGANPQRKSYASFASFEDPDGNGWVLQEITARLGPGLTPADARFTPEIVYAALHRAHHKAG